MLFSILFILVLVYAYYSGRNYEEEVTDTKKCITLKKVPDPDWVPDPNLPEFYDDHEEYGFTVMWNDDDDEAEIFELDQYKYRKNVDKKTFEKYLNRLCNINLQKLTA